VTFKYILQYCLSIEEIYEYIKGNLTNKNKTTVINTINVIGECIVSNILTKDILEKISYKLSNDLKICIGDSDQNVRKASIQVFAKLYKVIEGEYNIDKVFNELDDNKKREIFPKSDNTVKKTFENNKITNHNESKKVIKRDNTKLNPHIIKNKTNKNIDILDFISEKDATELVEDLFKEISE